jgi:hypothetical protein
MIENMVYKFQITNSAFDYAYYRKSEESVALNFSSNTMRYLFKIFPNVKKITLNGNNFEVPQDDDHKTEQDSFEHIQFQKV